MTERKGDLMRTAAVRTYSWPPSPARRAGCLASAGGGCGGTESPAMSSCAPLAGTARAGTWRPGCYGDWPLP